jgi:molecular chaperone DnaK (HSP70)
MALFHMQANAKSIDGQEMPLMTVIAESLKFIAERALTKLGEQIGKIVKKDKIRWVLTVPALWSEEHKLFMRKAAVEAGIIEHSNSPSLLLCLEPEGASIQCREDAEDTLKTEMIKGTIVLVLDCGGGTVDITVHKLTSDPHENFLCEEILPSSGGCEWGSKYVDKYFEAFLEEFFGPDLYEIYIKNAVARLEILKHFEMLKRKFNPGQDDRSRLQLSYLSEDLSPSKLTELIEKHNKTHASDFHLKQRGTSCVDVPPALMVSFFQPLFENIKSKVEQLLEQAESKAGYKAKFIFMVGGFSESPYLKSEVKKRFETETLNVLAPRRPQVSVIRGACMYGLNPRSITSRIAKKTYGINTLTTFDPERHPEEKKVITYHNLKGSN